jgi:hypothetical protein
VFELKGEELKGRRNNVKKFHNFKKYSYQLMLSVKKVSNGERIDGAGVKCVVNLVGN